MIKLPLFALHNLFKVNNIHMVIWHFFYCIGIRGNYFCQWTKLCVKHITYSKQINFTNAGRNCIFSISWKFYKMILPSLIYSLFILWWSETLLVHVPCLKINEFLNSLDGITTSCWIEHPGGNCSLKNITLISV